MQDAIKQNILKDVTRLFEQTFIDKASKVRRNGDEKLADWLLLMAKRCSNDPAFILKIVREYNEFQKTKKTMCASVYIDFITDVVVKAVDTKEFELNFDM